MAGSELDIDALIRGRRRAPRWRTLGILGAVGLVAAATAAYLLVRGDPAPVIAPPTESTATLGQLTTTSSLTGAAAAVHYEAMTFGASGSVTAVNVVPGDVVEEGDVLATLDTTALELGLRQAQLSLAAQQANLADLIKGSADPSVASSIANAQQAVLTAQTQVANSEDALDALVRPTNADVAAAETSMYAAEDALTAARDHLAALQNGPSAADRASASLSVANAQSQLISSATAVVNARNVNGVARSVAQIVAGTSTATADQIAALILQKPQDPLVSGAAQTAAEASYVSAKAQLQAAIVAQDELLAPATAADVRAAQAAITTAQQVYDEAAATASRLGEAWLATNTGSAVPAEDQSISEARGALAAAQAGLTASQANLASLLAGPDASSVATAQVSVAQAEANVLNAQKALDGASLVAPFGGTVEAVSIAVGDTVSAGSAAVELLDESTIEVELTVTETDLPQIEVGQVGLATFDAIEDQQYAVRVASISRVPQTQQGVVTYPVTATLLQGGDLAAAAGDLAALTGASAGGGGFPRGAAFGGGGGANGGTPGAGGGGGLLTGIEIPEGVTIADVLEALANGQPLPDGVTLPGGLEIGEALLERLRSGAAPGAAGAEAPVGAVRPMPAPGMSASVTVLTAIRDEAVLVPVAAVRLIDDVPSVRVPAGDGTSTRVEVTLGSSDGMQVEVLTGLDAGATVLVGAEMEGVPYTATTQSASSDVPPGGSFFGDGGGGFRFGGG